MYRNTRFAALLGVLMIVASTAHTARAADGFVLLFTSDGVPQGWRVAHWADVKDPPPSGAKWIVTDGVLHGSDPRGTWLVSEREYGDFVLQLEFKLGERGNSGVGLRFPLAGDPAFDGLELQIVDPRYYGDDKVDAGQLAGSLYPSLPPSEQVYRPTEWNRYEITAIGSHVTVKLNGRVIQDVNLDEHTKPLDRGEPLSKRPRRGHLGFQELSRGGGHVEIRSARIKEIGPRQ
jgi:hypothetical protein